jgi:GNAT superfamily N-acetyltransferase
VHGRGLLLRGLGSLALRPRLALHFARTRLARYCRRLIPNSWTRQAPGNPGGSGGPGSPPGTTAVLAHVVVVEHARHHGIGTALIARFVSDASDAGCARVSLVTAAGDGGAGPYYARLGWLPRGETSTSDGRRLAAYDFPLQGHRSTDSY